MKDIILIFLITTLLCDRIYSQGLKPTITYSEARAFGLKVNGYTSEQYLTEKIVSYYGDKSWERLNEFDRQAGFEKARKELLGRIRAVDTTKEYEARVSARLSEYNFTEGCFDITYELGFENRTRGNVYYILQKGIGSAAGGQDLRADNLECFNIKLYLSKDSAQALVKMMEEHGNNNRWITMFFFYRVMNKTVEGNLDLIADIKSIRIYETITISRPRATKGGYTGKPDPATNSYFPLTVKRPDRYYIDADNTFYYTFLRELRPHCSSSGVGKETKQPSSATTTKTEAGTHSTTITPEPYHTFRKGNKTMNLELEFNDITKAKYHGSYDITILNSKLTKLLKSNSYFVKDNNVAKKETDIYRLIINTDIIVYPSSSSNATNTTYYCANLLLKISILQNGVEIMDKRITRSNEGTNVARYTSKQDAILSLIPEFSKPLNRFIDSMLD
jgi:hypothetical protein